MKLERVAAVVEEFYKNGRVRTGGQDGLDSADFIEITRMAHGAVMYQRMKDLRIIGGAIEYYSQSVNRQEYDLPDQADGKGRKKIELGSDNDLLKLPRGAGIWGVTPADEPNCQCNDIVRVTAGGEWLLCGPEFEDMQYFVLVGNTIELYNLPKCVKKVEVSGIPSDDNLDIPPDIAFDMLNLIFGATLKLKGFPVDKTDNQNPNVQEIARLTQSQP